MTYIWKHGNGANRRVMHLAKHDPVTGEVAFCSWCGSSLRFDRACNLPLGRPVCKRCIAVVSELTE